VTTLSPTTLAPVVSTVSPVAATSSIHVYQRWKLAWLVIVVQMLTMITT
jgi:hypothetical protein